MPPRIAMQKFVEGSQNLRQTTRFVEGFAFDKPLSSKFVEKKFVEGSLTIITSSLMKLKMVVKLNLSNATHRVSPAGRRPPGRE
jgi:hypothetical protein